MSKRYIPRLKLVAMPDEPAAEGVGYKWAGGDVGSRHQLGGVPTEVQDETWPTCKSCDEEMTFFGQLDAPGDDFDLADNGLIQAFVCYGCFETHSRLVCY